MLPSPLVATTSAARLAEELERYRIVPAEQLRNYTGEIADDNAGALAELLVNRGELTTFQAEQALAGAANSLLLGPYRIRGPYHTGAFGPLLRADKNGAAFALRVMPVRSLWQAKQAKQMIRTFAPLANHSIVVPLVDADSANGFHYLAWPLVEGESLAQRVAQVGPLSSQETTALMAELAAGLAACHSRQIVHTLLTPRSVLLEGRTPRILESGAGLLLARNLAADESLFDTMSRSIAVADSLDYAAPEWLAQPANPEPAADQFALGAVGFFAATGTRPSLLPPQIPIAPDLEDLLRKLLQPTPGQRFTGMDEVRDLLRDLAGLARSTESQAVSRMATGRGELPGNNAVWKAPVLTRPTERDDTESSVHFNLPEDAKEPAGVEAREDYSAPQSPGNLRSTHRPIQPQATPPTAPSSPIPAESRRSNSRPESRVAPPPTLPAAPLITEPPTRSSGSWISVPNKVEPIDADQPSGSVLWKKMKRKVLFWQAAGDTVQISVFGPSEVTHSQAPKVTVFLHSPSVEKSVATLAQAFHHYAVLLGTCRVPHEVVRGSRLDVHFAVEHIAVSNPLASFKWQGQPHRLTFDLVIPWEAPLGNALGVVSVGHDDVRIGKVEFPVPILEKRSIH